MYGKRRKTERKKKYAISFILNIRQGVVNNNLEFLGFSLKNPVMSPTTDGL